MGNRMTKTRHEFGGHWTEDKLDRIQKYLQAYITIFTRNPKAQKLETIYVDAFAGTGHRAKRRSDKDSELLFPEWQEKETQDFLKGSAKIALETIPSFKKFLFIEQDPDYAAELQKLKGDFPQRAADIEIINQNSNSYLRQWCEKTDWRFKRAVVLLDPYGMQVEWSVIGALAKTKAIDLWILFPLGVAVNRLLTRHEAPSGAWAEALTRIFGTDAWREEFYCEETQQSLFVGMESTKKDADYKKIGRFFLARLQTVFTKVASNPLTLMNSRNVPLYLLCFAAGNPKGAPTAVKIAQDILGR